MNHVFNRCSECGRSRCIDSPEHDEHAYRSEQAGMKERVFLMGRVDSDILRCSV
jgi:hypothetical protein